jgi:hypothetical protein
VILRVGDPSTLGQIDSRSIFQYDIDIVLISYRYAISRIEAEPALTQHLSGCPPTIKCDGQIYGEFCLLKCPKAPIQSDTKYSTQVFHGKLRRELSSAALRPVLLPPLHSCRSGLSFLCSAPSDTQPQVCISHRSRKGLLVRRCL